MPLPLLPGLMKQDDENDDDLRTEQPSGLAQFLDGLDDSQVQELVAAADDYDQANPPDPNADPGDGDDAASEDEDGAGDTDPAPPPDAGDDDPPDPGSDDGAAPADLDAVDQQLDTDVEEAASVITQMQALADGDSDSAPDVAKLVKQATGLSDKIDKQRKLLDKALKAEDVQAAAQAGMDASDSLTAMQKLLEAAQALGAKTEAPPMRPGDHPAIKAWAAKTQGKKLGAPPSMAAAAPKPAFSK